MKKLNKLLKQEIKAGAAAKKMTKTAYFENILSTQMIGNSINNVLNLVNQMIYYSNPKNRRFTPNNFYSRGSYIRGSGTGYGSTINMG